MNCWKAQTMFSALADDELGAADSEALLDHLDKCPTCAKAHQKVQSHPAITCPELPSDHEMHLWDELDRRIAQGLAQDSERPLARIRGGVAEGWYRDLHLPLPLAVGYGLLLMLSIGFGLQSLHRAQGLETELAQSRAAIEVLATRAATQGSASVASAQTLAPDPKPDPTPAVPLDPAFAPALEGRLQAVGDHVVGPALPQ